MSLTNEDLNKIKMIVSGEVGATEGRIVRKVDQRFEAFEVKFDSKLESKLDAAFKKHTNSMLTYLDARFENQSIQMEEGFTHIRRQLQKRATA